MTLQEYQRRILERRAFDEGSAKDLVYFLAVLRDRDGLAALRGRIRKEDEAGRLAWDLMALEERPDRAVELLPRVAAFDDPWFFHTLTKALLGQGRFKEALALAQQRLKQSAGDTSVINLVAKWLLGEGEHVLALEVAKRSLRLAPRQEDMQAVVNRAARKGSLGYPLYLDVLPKAETVSFYLPVYNVERYIRLTIEGVCAQSHPLEEVIVVNDGTQDGSMAVAREHPVRIVEHERNRGLAAARNTAFRQAVSRFVGAVDTDAHPDPEFTRNILMEFEHGAPQLAGAGGQLIEIHRTEPADRWRARHMAQQQGPARIYTPEGLYGSNTLFIREAVLAVGGYDEQHRTNGEDVALCHALRGGGYAFFYTPNAVAYHERVDTPESAVRTSWAWAVPGKRQAGYYRDPALLLFSFGEILRSIQGYFELDRQLGDGECAYIDLLLLFYIVFLDLEQALREGSFSAKEVRFLEDGMLNTLRHLEARLGEGIRARVERDVAHLMHEADDGMLRDALRTWMEDFDRQAAEAFGTLAPELYAEMVGSEK